MASGIPIKVKTVVNLVNKIIGKGVPEFNKLKLNTHENKELFANIKKIKKELNWKPKVSLLKGLNKTINAFKK